MFLECIQNFDDGECGEPLATAEIPAAPINTVEEEVNDAQTLAHDMIVQIEHPALGMARSIGNPIKFSETPVRAIAFRSPLLGKHTNEIFSGLAIQKRKRGTCLQRQPDIFVLRSGKDRRRKQRSTASHIRTKTDELSRPTASCLRWRWYVCPRCRPTKTASRLAGNLRPEELSR